MPLLVIKRILVIRGGALGDFVLTLPALKALRVAHPKVGIEILGYPHIAAIADKRFYAEAVRSIEYAALSRFFAREAELPPELCEYFAGFDLILSYLYDPDRIFEENLRRCGAENILRGPSKIVSGMSAAEQLAQPLQEIGITATDLAPKIFPSTEDRKFASAFLENCEPPFLAVHPGSGSEKKNWPIENWIELIAAVLNGAAASRSGCFSRSSATDLDEERLPSRSRSFRSILIVSGEADENARQTLRTSFDNESRVRFAHHLPLPQLAALLQQSTFIGHDSGISHLAAAAGAHSIILFGPTDPNVWAPQNKEVTVLIAPNDDLTQLAVVTVFDAITH
ncbi:MAG TPA: glycosyltransferase family 9 protein [Chthoniobacterales bacterium]|nr:glycosyltransferase family 9 protein [Chthoniobacterales bacterium]